HSANLKHYLCHMASVRLEKFASLMKRELAMLFQQNSRNWVEGLMVTITQVRVAPDLSLAKVYISVFPSEKKEIALKGLKSNHSAVKRELGLKVGKQMRKVPELQYYIDDSLDYFETIDNLLKK
ncbi:MAG: 30S ribosome-binding factor RbfA, partial [Bacteroidota bacterium]